MAKIILPELETERLLIRQLTLDDRDAIFKWAGDPRVNKYMIYPLYKKVEEVERIPAIRTVFPLILPFICNPPYVSSALFKNVY